MPTKKQLYRNWESQIGFFGGSGLPRQSFEIATDGNGLTAEKFVDKPLVAKNHMSHFNGEVIGTITINDETKEVKIIPNSP